MTTVVKLAHGGETRRVSFSVDRLTYQNFSSTVQTIFTQLAGKSLSYIWIDEDGDEITVTSETEFQEAVRCMQTGAPKPLRFEIRLSTVAVPTEEAPTAVKEAPKKVPVASPVPVEAVMAAPVCNPGAVHEGIRCDECNTIPIIGTRYKCTVRDDFDLCAACEAKKTQPYPMIKITDPAHAPAALFYAFRDQDEDSDVNGLSWRRGGMRHPHHHHHHHHHQHPAHHPPHHPHRDGRHHLRHLPPPHHLGAPQLPPRPLNSYDSPDFGAPQAPAQRLATERDRVRGPSPPPRTSGPAKSLAEKISELRARNRRGENVKHISPHADIIVDLDSSPSPSVSVVSLPKPALRFVKDLTYPDGSSVPPLTLFRKAWKVRNDGAAAWPEGCVLVTAGGDSMCSESIRLPLPTLSANEETEVTVELLAPERLGLYTTYFRAQTSEGQLFGHRLWAAILVVASEERDWQVIAPAVYPYPDAVKADAKEAADVGKEEFSKVGDAAAEETAMSAAMAVIGITSGDVITPVLSPVMTTAAPTRAGEGASVGEVTEHVEDAIVEPSVAAGQAPPPAPSVPEAGQKPLFVLWRRELEILADMGFTDAEVNLPLLQQHLVTPLALTGDRNGVPSMEGMQRVVVGLLAMV